MSERPDVKPLTAEEEATIKMAGSAWCGEATFARLFATLDAVRAERGAAQALGNKHYRSMHSFSERALKAEAALARFEARVAELVAAAKQVGGQEIVFEGCRCVAIPIEAQEAIDAALTGNGAAAAAVIAATEPGEAKP